MKCQHRNCTNTASEVVRIRVEGETFSKAYHICMVHLIKLQRDTDNGTTVAGNPKS